VDDRNFKTDEENKREDYSRHHPSQTKYYASEERRKKNLNKIELVKPETWERGRRPYLNITNIDNNKK
jgi:hypothetical protein